MGFLIEQLLWVFIVAHSGLVNRWTRRALTSEKIGSIPTTAVYFKTLTRGGAVWKLAGLILQRSQVQILFPLFRTLRSIGRAFDC